jgi:putative transcriptional regulator
MASMKGFLLVASPGLVDPNFVRTVVFVAEHNEEGALGLILNRSNDLSVKDLWLSLSGDTASTERKTFVGGPVQKNAVLILHGHEDLAGENAPVIPGVYLGSEVEVLAELIRRDGAASGEERPGRYRVFCGYSGWGAGQLDAELRAGGWITVPATAEHVFDHPPDRLWNTTMGSAGGANSFFALMPPDPEMN